MDHLSIGHDIFYSETNALGRLSLPAVFSLMQEGAVRHADELGIGQKFCDETDSIWVLSRMDVRINRIPEYRDIIDVETWTKGTSGPFAVRDYTISTKNPGANPPDITGTSCWLLLDTRNMRPRNPGKSLQGVPVPEGREAIPGTASRISITGPLIETINHRPVYSDIDGHNHVNNVRYVQWCMDMFPPQWHQEREIRSFSINYLKAAEFGDELSIGNTGDHGIIYFQGTLGSGEKSFVACLESSEKQ